MKGLRNKVILSGIVLMFAFIATIGSTYAWFTVSTETSVEALDMQVTAADNLLIRIKKLNDGVGGDDTFANSSNQLDLSFWETGISQQDLIDSGYLYEDTVDPQNPSVPWRLKPSTVVDPDYLSFDAKTLSYIGNLDDQDRTLTTITTQPDFNDNSGYYIKLELYLLSQSDNPQPIELDPGVTNITADNSDPLLNVVTNATRFSIWLDDGVTTGSAFIYGNDTDYLFDFDTNDDGATTVSEGELQSGTASDLTTPTYFNALSDIETVVSGNTLVTDLSTSVIDIQDTSTSDGGMRTDIYTIQPNTPTLVTVLIYIEGWDAQTTNAIVSAAFNVSFGFMFEDPLNP